MHLRARPHSGSLSYGFGITLHGNERWTVNLVPAQITRKAGAPLSTKFSKLRYFSKFRKFRPTYHLSKKLQPNRTFPWHCHSSILWAPSKSLIHNLTYYWTPSKTCRWFLIKNIVLMVKTTGVRGPTLAPLAMVLVLLPIGDTPALRVITLHWEYSCSTSYDTTKRWHLDHFRAVVHQKVGAPVWRA